MFIIVLRSIFKCWQSWMLSMKPVNYFISLRAFLSFLIKSYLVVFYLAWMPSNGNCILVSQCISSFTCMQIAGSLYVCESFCKGTIAKLHFYEFVEQCSDYIFRCGWFCVEMQTTILVYQADYNISLLIHLQSKFQYENAVLTAS